jgi:carbamoyltransferase
MTAILGISAFYHDSAAALVVDGDIVAAAQEERFTRKKHDADFPLHAIEFCLAQAGIRIEDLDHVAFYDKPLLKFERLLETYLSYGPVGYKSFVKAMPVWLKQKLYIPREMNRGLGGRYKKRYVYTEHHESHAASAFFPSPFEEAAVMTLDGVGEWATASFGYGKGNHLALTHELHFPHSLGLLYSAFTYYCGFKVNSGEYKLMGLAPYGEPKYTQLILDNLLDLKDDGSFRMDMSYFNYCQGLTMTSAKFHQLFGGPPRKPETPVAQRDMDIAASIQKVTEEVMLRMSRFVHAQTGSKNLCLAGGVALNCVGNGRVLREGPFENIWIQPAAGDAGGALGAALFVWYQLLGNAREPRVTDQQYGSLLGPRFCDEEIRSFLDGVGAAYHHYDTDEALCDTVATLMADENVVGWFQGRMEFGPRALGARSIIGDARSTAMQSVMNLKIKFRESFRPFAPSVLEERAQDYFGLKQGVPSPYMLLVAPVNEQRRKTMNGEQQHLQGIEKLKVPRSDVPAITHVDYSARVQTVDPARHGRYRKLIERFEAKTGCAVIINTSFNVRGEPIVCTPEDAYRCFLNTNMDVLVLERFVLLKKEQPNAGEIDNSAYLAQFALD